MKNRGYFFLKKLTAVCVGAALLATAPGEAVYADEVSAENLAADDLTLVSDLDGEMVSSLDGEELLTAGTFVPTTLTSSGSSQLIVHFINVRKADAILLQKGDYVCLVDAGKGKCGTDLVTYMRNCGIDHVDDLVLSHFHYDHCQGAPAIIKAFGVNGYGNRVIVPSDEKWLYSGVRSAAKKIGGIRYTVPERGDILYDNDGLTIKVLSDSQRYMWGGRTAAKLNNSSLVLKVTYGSRSFLLTGDISKTAERELLTSSVASDLDCDVLKVAHHGSYSSSCAEFLQAVSPDYSVLETETIKHHKEYNCPSVKERLRNYSSKGVLGTWEDGTIIMNTDGTNLEVHTLVTPSGEASEKKASLGGSKFDFRAIDLPTDLYNQGTPIYTAVTKARKIRMNVGETIKIEYYGDQDTELVNLKSKYFDLGSGCITAIDSGKTSIKMVAQPIFGKTKRKKVSVRIYD